MINFKKPSYIRKYDFIRFFIRNRDEWFWPTKVLTDYIDDSTAKLSQGGSAGDTDDEKDGQEDKFDSYDFLKENTADKFTDMDKNDPKVYEGNLIDKSSQEYICSKYATCKNLGEIQYLNNDDSFNKTLELLKNYDNIIIFQPTFIYKNKAIAKPDAIVKLDGKYYLIEVKGTSTAKPVHLLDFIYQSNVVEYVLQEKLSESIEDYYLCIADYCLANKREVKFALTNRINISPPSSPKNLPSEKLSQSVISIKKNLKQGKYLIKNLVKGDSSELKVRARNKYEEIFVKLTDEAQFDLIIDELAAAEINENPQFEPCEEYKLSGIKTVEYWLNIRSLWSYMPKYFMFAYSGNLVSYRDALDSRTYSDEKSFQDDFIAQNGLTSENEKTRFAIYYDGLKSMGNKPCSWDNNATDKKIKEIKDKKVYFDFESLNLATRVVDNTLPFMQIVNQISVVFDHGDGNIDQCNNIVIDPKQIGVDSFKQIINALWPESNQDDYSYIVYNKSFECTRLNEMAEMIDEPEYTQKVQTINKNIYDLADLFTLSNKNPFALIFKELRGFYSIKKVLPLVDKYAPHIFAKTKCVDYKSGLNIHNGGQAQTEATKRFFNLLENEEWSVIETDLKKYCENDVRAMIAVEYFIREIVSNKIKWN